jgi:hypothetical protein
MLHHLAEAADSKSPVLLIIVVTAAAIGAVLTPLLVLLGRELTRQRGLFQIQGVFTTPEAVKMYFKVHHGEDVPFDEVPPPKPLAEMSEAELREYNKLVMTKPVERISWEFLRWQSLAAYAVALVPLTILAASAVVISANAAYTSIQGNEGGSFGVPLPAVAALMGAFVWSLYEIFRHEVDRDLTPQAIWEIVIRYLAAIPIGYALTSLTNNTNIGAALGFGATAFPMKDLRYFIRERVIRAIGAEAQGAGALEGTLNVTVDGLSAENIARFQEFGIFTFVDLAYADPIRLMTRTGRPLRQLLTWIDQSLVSIYASALRAKFTEAGLPCSLDIAEVQHRYCAGKTFDECVKDPRVVALATRIALPVELLPDLLRRIAEDPQVRLLGELWYVDLAQRKQALADEAAPK